MIAKVQLLKPNSTNIGVKENINVLLSLVAERLNTTKSESEAQEIYDNVDDLAEALFENDFEKANKAWDNLAKTSLTEWKEKHLPRIIQNQQNDYIEVKNFLKSPMAKEMNNMDIIKTFFKSDTVTIEEKAFLAKKAESREGYDLCKFLSEHVPSNKSRQVIINNLIENEKIADENFEFLKNEFIKIVREQDSNNAVADKNIQQTSLVNLFLLQTPYVNSLYSMNKSEKLAALNNYPTEELDILAKEVKDKYLVEKSKEAFEDEAAKYDLAPRLDEIINNLELEIDGKKCSITTVINNRNNEIEKISQSSKMTQAQLNAVMAHLTHNTQEAKEMHAMLGAILTRIQANNPQYAAQCQQARSFLQKLKDGLITPSNLGAITFGVPAATKIVTAGGAIFGPAGAGAGALLSTLVALFTISGNLQRSFSQN